MRNLPLFNKWIAALKGDEYEQAQGALKNSNGFCCLGVLCDVVDQEKWIKDNSRDVYAYDGDWQYLSKDMREKIGLTDGEVNKLGELNDNENYTFMEIADYLENEILKESF